MSDYDSIRSGLEALGKEAHGVIARANQEIAAGDQLLSVAQAVRYLADHNQIVHENTVRNWYRSGRIQIVRGKLEHDKRVRGPQVLIPLSTLAKIAACPFCGSR